MPDITTGLLGHWPFDGSAVDVSGNGRDATLSGSPSYGGGRIGDGLQLNGSNQYATIPDAAAMSPASITVACWANRTGAGASEDYQILFDNIQWGSAGYSLFFEPEGTHVIARMHAPGFAISGFEYNMGSTTGLHHFAYTFDASTGAGRLYIDGALAASSSGLLLGPGSEVNLHIGVNSGIGGAFEGVIDDVRVYNRALTADDIAALYAWTGDVEVEPVEVDLGVTEPLETLASEVITRVTADLALTEPGESLTAAMTAAVTAELQVTEEGESLVSAIVTTITADLALTEPLEALEAVVSPLIEVEVAITEDGETLEAGIASIIAVEADIVEPGETLTASLSIGGGINLDVVEPLESLVAEIATGIIAALAVTEEGETLAATIETRVLADLVVTEPGEALVVEIELGEAAGPVEMALDLVEPMESLLAEVVTQVLADLNIIEPGEMLQMSFGAINPGIITATIGPRIAISAGVGAGGSEVAVGPRIRISQ